MSTQDEVGTKVTEAAPSDNEDILNAIQLGIQTEADSDSASINPGQLGDAQIKWLADWLAGEGFARETQVAEQQKALVQKMVPSYLAWVLKCSDNVERDVREVVTILYADHDLDDDKITHIVHDLLRSIGTSSKEEEQ